MFNVNRNGWFHFRLRIPQDLTDIVGSTHIQCPLKTKQKRVANKLSLELRDRFVPQFQKLRIESLSGASHDQLQRLAVEMLPVRSGHKKARRDQATINVSNLSNRLLHLVHVINVFLY